MTTFHTLQAARGSDCPDLPESAFRAVPRSASSPAETPSASREMLVVEPWLDPLIDAVGHDPRSSYVERFWLPVLGPSTTWLLRHLVTRLEESPGSVELDVEDTARALGLGERMGPNAPFARTVKRCVDFDMAQWRDPTHLAVRRRLAPLARRHLRRLPESLQASHDAELNSAGRVPAVERLRRHGRQLALSLVDLGEDPSGTDQQLRRWAFHPALASECAAWAIVERTRRTAPAPSPDADEPARPTLII